LFDTLDLLKAADTVLFLTSVQGVDAEGQITLTAALAQGLPTTLVVCTDIDTVPLKVLYKWFMDMFKLYIHILL
jgi:hypothetical protein